MIQVQNLTKIYKSQKDEVKALDDLSFSLPDKGLVFIIGKSGSGKSTLINMIGGLDDITSGDIFVDGMQVKKFSQRELDEYHNNYLGIIYQNYNLFEEETVLENIKIANRICLNKRSDEEIDELLDSLELLEKKDKPVSNLSGGQKQRVAIARALVKNPKLILADEPTGNLDSRTTKNIFNLLSKISKDRLVIVITHDLKSALNYADRILSLSDGKIVKDLTKGTTGSKQYTYIELDESQELSDERIDSLNVAIKKSKYRVIRKGEHFKETKYEETEGETLPHKPQKTKLTLRRSLLTGLKTSKRSIFTMIGTVLVNMLIIALLSLSTSFIHFEGENAINDVIDIYDVNNLVIRKSYSTTGRAQDFDKERFYQLNEEDENHFSEMNLKGKRYPIYNTGMTYGEAGAYIDSTQSSRGINFDYFYPNSGYGVVACDKEYLENVFGGELTVLAGSLYGLETSTKIVISDFIADAILFYSPGNKSDDPSDPYQKIISSYAMRSRNKVAAVIKTNYKEKYGAFLDVLDRIVKEPQNATEIRKAIFKSDLYTKYINEAQTWLNFGYSLNPNYMADYRLNNIIVAYFGNSTFMVDEDDEEQELKSWWHIYAREELTGNNMYVQIETYNQMFGTNYTTADVASFKPHDITIRNYSRDDEYKTKPIRELTFHIEGLINSGKGREFYVCRDMYPVLSELFLYQYGWTYTEPTDCFTIYQKMTRHSMYNPLECFTAVFNTIQIVEIFSQVFSILLYILLAVMLISIIMHNIRLIRKEQYRLGVYKSLGYSNLYLTVTILVTNLVMWLAIFGISLLFSFGTSFLFNYFLQLGFAKYTSNAIFYKITMLVFRFDYTVQFILVALGEMFISSFVPLLAIRNIKPNKIIRNAE